jgi:hypothetical protein
MPNLASLEARWIELFDELCSSHSVDSAQIAAPFFSVPATEVRSLLYIGKATAKDWNRDDFFSLSPLANMKERREQGRKFTKTFLTKYAPSYNSGFWHFAKVLNTEAAKKWNRPVKNPFQHITYTNLSKIGALKGNPRGFLLKEQRELAFETLRLEIELYKPELICFVTWDHEIDVVRRIIDDPNDASWNKAENNHWLWWRAATAKLPPILLTGHPQGKSLKDRERWLKKFWSLLPV